MFAIVSDIHGNLEALAAVLAEIDRRGIQQVYCLGDVIGYGPDPKACLDAVRARCAVTLMGNHDFAVLYEPYNFNTGAEAASYWTRGRFESEQDLAVKKDRWAYLGGLPVRHEFQHPTKFAADTGDVPTDVLLVHASPRRPINEYLFPDDIYTNPGKFPSVFDKVGRLCFCGHTHVPGVFLEGPDFYSPDELDFKYPLTDEKAVINVGSVGQPRDRDPRSSFVVVDDEVVEFVRVEYDVKHTVEKVRAVEELDNFLGTRLLDGR